MSCWPQTLKEGGSSPSPPATPVVMTMTSSLHDELSASSPKSVGKEDELLEVISDPKSAVTYRRGRLIGKGGFAKVYEVTELLSNKCFADKVINREVFARRSTSKDKVKREIMLHKDLIHPNVVGFCHFFTDDRSNVHIILEYCSMKSLLHVMKNRKVLTEPEVRYYMLQICEGVRYIHHRSILHRDLKLGNMFLTWDMTLKIGDFGLATQMPTENGPGGNNNTLCGTPNYIAPEVLRKQGHGVEADIWAMGCMMFAMLVGTPPFETKSLGRTYQKIAANEYEIPDRLSPSASAFIRMLLHPEPQLRGHLHQIGHPDDLVSHSFFSNGFCPKILPPSATTHPPKMPVETLYDSNLSVRSTENPTTLSSDTVNPNSSIRLRSALKQKFSQMFNAQNYNYRKRDRLIFQVIDAVDSWLNRSVIHTSNANGEVLASPLSFVPIFVSKWIDYSNKYGFGYQLSDRSVGVLFNDNTRISRTADNRYNEFADAKGKLLTFPGDNPGPAHSGGADLGGRIRLLDYFARYMDENLAEGVTASLCLNQMTLSTLHKTLVPHVVRWLRTQSTVIMALNNSSVQINFIRDHAKMIFWGDPSSAFLFVTYLSADHVPLTYNLRSLPRARLHAAIEQKISQSLEALRELADKLITLNAVEQ